MARDFRTKAILQAVTKGRREVQELEKSIRKLDDTTKTTEKSLVALKGASKAAFVVGLGAATVAVAATTKVLVDSAKVGKEFEKTIQEAAAIAGGGFDEMARKAKELGSTTAFTATQVGEAEVILTRAGFSLKENLEAVGPILKLAGATVTDMAGAASIASTTLRAYNLEAGSMVDVTDQLAQTAALSNQSLTDLGEALKLAAPVTAQFGLGLDQTNALLAEFANLGFKGTLGGTALVQAFAQFKTISDKGIATLEKYNLTLADVDPTARNLVDIIKDLAETGIDAGEVLELLGPRAAKPFIAIIAKMREQMEVNGRMGTSFDELAAKIGDSAGKTAEQYEQMMDTVQGRLDILNSTIESIQLEIFDTFKEDLKGVIEEVTATLNQNREALISFFGGAAKVGKFFVETGLEWLEILGAIDTQNENLQQHNRTIQDQFSDQNFQKAHLLRLEKEINDLLNKQAEINAEIRKNDSSGSQFASIRNITLKKQTEEINKQIKALTKERQERTAIAQVAEEELRLNQDIEESIENQGEGLIGSLAPAESLTEEARARADWEERIAEAIKKQEDALNSMPASDIEGALGIFDMSRIIKAREQLQKKAEEDAARNRETVVSDELAMWQEIFDEEEMVSEQLKKDAEEVRGSIIEGWEMARDLSQAIIKQDWSTIGVAVGGFVGEQLADSVKDAAPDLFKALGGAEGMAGLAGQFAGLVGQGIQGGFTGQTTGQLAGLAAGGLLGSLVPGGTLIGAGLGSALGGALGGAFGGGGRSAPAPVKVVNAQEIADNISASLGATALGAVFRQGLNLESVGDILSRPGGALRTGFTGTLQSGLDPNKLLSDFVNEAILEIIPEFEFLRGDLEELGVSAADAADVAARFGVSLDLFNQVMAEGGTVTDLYVAQIGQLAGALGVSENQTVQMIEAIREGVVAQEALNDAQELGKDATQNEINARKNLEERVILGNQGLDEYTKLLSEMIDELNESRAALEDFNETMDEKIARASGDTATFLAKKMRSLKTEMAEAATATEVLSIANERVALATELNGEAQNYVIDILSEASQKRIDAIQEEIDAEERAMDEAKDAIKELTDAFSEFTGVISELKAAEVGLMQVESDREDFASRVASTRFRIGNRFEESNAEEQFPKLLDEFESLGGTAALTQIAETGIGDPKQLQLLQSLIDEAFGTVDQAHNQTLISDQEALARLDILEGLQETLFGARQAVEEAGINRILDEVSGTAFAQDSGIADFIAEQREAGVLPSADEIAALGDAFLADRQLALQTSIDEHQANIDSLTQDIKDIQSGLASDIAEVKAYFQDRLVEDLRSIQAEADAAATTRINTAQEAFDIAFTGLLDLLQGWNPELAASLNNWLADQAEGGFIPQQGSRS